MNPTTTKVSTIRNELELWLPELNSTQLNWLVSFIQVQISQANRNGFEEAVKIREEIMSV